MFNLHQLHASLKKYRFVSFGIKTMAGLAIWVIKLLVILSLKLNRFISDNTLQCTSVVARPRQRIS
jgi:hypothetical protein